MAFVDELIVGMKAGRGGDGAVRWLREKFREFGGPAGGNGGNGGDVYIEGIRDIGILSKYSFDPSFVAENGDPGGGAGKEGKNGEDLIIKIPLGSVVKNLETKEEVEILNEREKVLLLKGGRGGLGNEHFKSSKNVSPQESTPGKPGEKGRFLIELRLIADAGFIGLPSAGKSSLLNSLTNAKSKVGEYHFTTLEPHLGALYGLILADIPGLIEGASEGKGLGHKFLRHITRVRVIFHLVSMESETPKEDYQVIRKELADYSEDLIKKREIIILSKTDLASPEDVEALKHEFEADGKEVLTATILDDGSIKKLKEEIVRILESQS